MKGFYLYSEKSIHRTIKELFVDFEIHDLSKEDIKKNKITNKNILLVLYESLPIEFSENFFLKNNVAIFFSKQNSINKIQHLNIKILIGHTNINKVKDEITTFFVAKTFSYKNIKIFEEKIVNTKSNSGVFLTPSEKDILLLLFERKKIEKNFLLESVLKLRKDTETKTIESHLTRIRKKLLRINSQIEITSKDNMVFLIT